MALVITIHTISAEELKQALSQDALTNYGVLGDSGSPLFAFDKQKNQWVFLGTYDYWAGYGKKSWQEWNIYKKEFADKIKQHDNAGTIKGNGEHHWKTTGTNSHIGSTAVRLANNERDANNGQNVTFEDNGTLVLDQNINQGAGGLFFKGDYTVKGANSDITWLGAGIDVADGKKVVWQVKNPQGDKLAKIGKGALEINGTGVNQGELKVGDGTVILNQKADSNQKVQAFSQVGIVSGRGTLVLNSPDQINPNNLYFGFRGGRLDANGNDLTFEHIRNVDEGARVVNHNTSNASTITLTGKSLITDPKGLSIHYIQNNDYDDDGYYGYYYRPRKPIPQGKDLYFKNYRYYALKPGGSVNSPMPENGVAENNDWVFMGYTEEKAKKNVMNHKNNQRISGFSGFFGEENGKGHNGALNLNFNGKSAQNRFLLTGGTNLNGKISVTQGNVLLSGRPTPHARDFVNKSSAYKDAHFSKNNEVVFEDDWINRTFKAAEITVNQSASLSSGRNVSNITANITATDNAKVNLGYKNGDEVCVRSDYTGYVTCTKDNLSDKALNSFDATQINGNVNLSQNAALTLGKAALWGQIQGQGNSRVSLNQHSKWHLTGDSQVQNLSLEDSHIHLNNASDAQSANKYHTLKINHLSGNGHFHYLTHLAKNLGDKVVVKESASGHYQLHVQDKTGEPNQEGLDLFDASSVQDRSRLSVSLANHHVDLGALRYTIKTENGITRLYNPYAENRRRVKPVPSPATNTASQAQKATQTDGAQIAKPQNIVIAPPSPQANQAEEAKRQQAEAEKVARRKAEEAKRQAAELLAKQKAEAEAQALAARRQAEAERKARELAEREKAEAERKAAELAKQKAEQAKAQPKRRRRRAAPQNNVAIAQAQEARRQQAEAERVARLKAEEAKRQSEMLARQKSEEERKARELAEREKAEAEKVARRKAEEAKRQAAELLAKQKAEAEAQALAARRQAEAERKARELAEREKAEAERKAAELAKQKAEQAKAQPKRRRRRAAPQNNVAIAQAQEARRQQAEAERVARLKAEEAKRQSEMLARQKSEEERKARELAEREKAEAERKAEELAKQKAEEASHQAKVQPKRRRRRAILPRPPAPVFSLDDYDAKDNSESSIGNLARVTPRMKRELIDDFEEIPLSALEEAETTTNITDNIGKDIQEILDDEFENTDIEPLIDSLGQVVRLQPRTLSPMENMSQAQAISKNTNTALSDAMVSSQFILLDTGSSLVQQITQTELSANKENNVWVSNTTYDRHYSSTQYRQFSAKRSQIQIGIDHYLSKNTQVGTVLSYVRNSNVFDQASGKNTFVQANTYGKYYFDYGWYISGDIGVGQLRSQLQTQQKAKFNRIATQAGIMIGNRIDINRFEILPSIGVRYSYLSSIDYKLGSDSLKVDSISIKTALAKLDLAYQFNIGEFALKPILSMAYVINSGEGIVNIGGQNYRYKSDNQQQYSAGMALNYRSLTFNINGGAIKGRQLSNQKFLQIKMQVSF